MITVTWNHGENAIMLSPSVKVWAILLGIFTVGVVCVGLAGLALIEAQATLSTASRPWRYTSFQQRSIAVYSRLPSHYSCALAS